VNDEFHKVSPEIRQQSDYPVYGVFTPPCGRRKRVIRVGVLPISEHLLIYRSRGRAKVKDEGVCRMCRRPDTSAKLLESPDGARPLTRHHLIPDVWFRDQAQRASTFEEAAEWRRLSDVDANIIPLCRLCHDLVEAVDDEGRRLLRKVFTEVEVAYALVVRGRDWLDWRYPPLDLDRAHSVC